MITSDVFIQQYDEINSLDYPDFNVDNFEQEPIFPVDLNTRTIQVPSNFTTVAVVGDHCSETIWFLLNRYFDGQDLGRNTSRKTWGVQFTNAKGKTMLVNITYRKLGSEANPEIIEKYGLTENHLLLGWQITRDVTAKEGDVSFSLRCFETESEADLDVKYSLSTKPATIKIAPSHNVSSWTEGLVPSRDALTDLVAKIDSVLSDNGEINGAIPWDKLDTETMPVINGYLLNKDIYLKYADLEQKPRINGTELTPNIEIAGLKRTVLGESDTLSVDFPTYSVNGTPLVAGGNVEVAGKPDQSWIEGSENAVASKIIKAEIDAIKAELGELTYIPLSILSFAAEPSMAEKGDILNTIKFDWNLSKVPNALSINEISLTNTDETYTLESANLTEDTEFVLTALDKGNPIKETINIRFVNRIYWGVSEEKISYDSDFIKGLEGNQLDFVSKFNVNAGANQYIYFAAPAAYAEPTFTLQGSMGGKWQVAATVNYINGSETTSYKIYRSDYANLGDTTILIS